MHADGGQATVRRRVLRAFVTRGWLEPDESEEMLAWGETQPKVPWTFAEQAKDPGITAFEQVMHETYHSAEAITRYLVAFKQVLLCHRKGLSTEEIAFAVKMSKRLVEEYQRLIAELASKNASLDRLIEDSLGSLLKSNQETDTV